MKRTTSYSRVESVVYTFTEGDIQRALMQFFNVVTGAGSKIEFNMWGEDYRNEEIIPNSGGAEIIVRYEEEEK